MLLKPETMAIEIYILPAPDKRRVMFITNLAKGLSYPFQLDKMGMWVNGLPPGIVSLNVWTPPLGTLVERWTGK